MISLLTSGYVVCLIACHSGPADHFASFADGLPKDVAAVEIYASGPALKKFQERGIEVKAAFSLEKISPEEEDALAEQLAKACSFASVVITDVGHTFDIKVQEALSRQAKHTPRFAYYDNPEPYVPGGYSEVASQVMLAASGVLFANSHLEKAPIFQAPGKEISFEDRKKIGIGYYPVNQAEKVALRRASERLFLRETLFAKNNLTDAGQTIVAYFGGNNEAYFSRALPSFLALLDEGMKRSDFTSLIVLFQQHPGAKNKNIDTTLLSSWISQHSQTRKAPLMILSDFSTDDVQTIADVALYYQSSMAPQFLLAGIPTIQVGHEPFEDILVKNQLIPSVTDANQFISAIADLLHQNRMVSRQAMKESLGIKADWLLSLQKEIEAPSQGYLR